MSTTKLRGASLAWGQGPRVLEMFLEPTCPFSVKAFYKIKPLLANVGEDKLTVKIRIQSQPWHLFSGIVCRAILAASSLANGREKAWKVLEAVAGHREEFVFVDHATGPNRDVTPNEVLARLHDYSGVDFSAAFDQPELQDLIKWQAKYARQNGIHVSPTFMLDGLIVPTMSSGDDVNAWADLIFAD